MTICASVKVRDGLILGTDSMVQIWGEDAEGNRGPVKTYGHGRKLFQVGKLPIGVMSYGIGNLGPRSIQNFVLEFSSSYSDQPEEVESIADGLLEFFRQAYEDQFADNEQRPPLGFFVAGYSPSQPFAEEWEFLLPRDSQISQVRPGPQFGASWRGVDKPFTRLYKGFDPRAIVALRERGIADEVINETVKAFECPVIYDGMPVQDAVDFVVFILQTTIRVSTFEIGYPTCGEPLQVASILPPETFQWVSEPSLAIL